VTVAGDQFQVGDKLYIVGYRGERVFSVWYDGKVQDIGDFWTNVGEVGGAAPGPPDSESAHGLVGHDPG
jgi:hypothetical protein